MRYISTFSGVEAASQAWRPLGWEPLCFAEVEPFPCAVLAERFPGVPNLGDVTKVDWSPYRGQADLMVGGSPCFPAGTPVVVRRPDGSAVGVPIEGVRVGDEVLTHRGRFRKVLATGSKVADTVLLRTDDGVGDAIECTPNHPFLSVRMLGHGACGPRDDLEWVQASEMVGRCALAVNVDGGPLYDPVRVLSVSEGRRGVRVYNMSVEEDESYTAWGLAVHNCQSFSIAGKREGLDGASGLMWEWVRCVREVRPRWVVWENVPGCLSSGGGEDFRCLLKSLDDLGYDACWRVLDARFFGVPQRRRRVFLVGRLADGRGGRHLPCEVLLEPEGLPWDTREGQEARQGAPGGAGRGVASAGFKSNISGVGRSIGYEEECSPTILSSNHSPGVLTALNPHDSESVRVFHEDGVAPTVTSQSRGCGEHVPRVLTYGIRTANTSSNGWGVQEEQSHTLGCTDRDAVLCVNKGSKNGVSRDEDTTLTSSHGTNGNVPCLLRMREGCAGGGKGPLVQRDMSGTLATNNDQTLYDPCISFSDDSKVTVGIDESPTCTRNHCDHRVVVAGPVGVKQNQRYEVTTAPYTGCLAAQQSGKQVNGVMAEGIVRRLTPLECERLQGFEDGWTRIPWKGKPASECPDAPRYRAIGNSMAVPVMRWIGERIDACDRYYAQHPDRLADLDGPTEGEQLTLF